MKDKYVKSIIKNLIDECRYNVIELDANARMKKLWGASRNIDGNEIVLCFLEKEDINDFHYYEEKIFINYPNCQLINILLIDEEFDINMLTTLNSSLQHKDTPALVIDYANSKSYYYGDNHFEEVINEVVKVVNYTDLEMKQTSKIKSISKYKATYGLIAINIIMYIITAIISATYYGGSIFSSSSEALISLGGKYNPLINSGEYFRLITCMFLHGGVVHLGFNMYALYAIGPLIEDIYGNKKFILIYLISGIMSSLLSYIASPSLSIGASGAIFGLFGAALVFGIKMKEKIGKEFFKSILSVIVVNAIIGISLPNIDNFGHLGGVIGGMIVASLVKIDN